MRLLSLVLRLIPQITAIVIPSLTSPFNLDQFQVIKLALENELQSVMPNSIFDNTIVQQLFNTENDNKELILIPRILLLDSLYLEPSNSSVTSFDMSFSNGDNIEIHVPLEVQSLFMFQTDSTTKDFNKEKITSAFPFKFPTYTNLVDYYLACTKDYVDTNFPNLSSTYSNSILRVPLKKVPIFKGFVKDDLPLLVFMFNDRKDDVGKCMESVVTAENYLSTSMQVNQFFDGFAKKWVQTFGDSNLRQSIFCMTNPQEINYSYCLNIEEAYERLHVFPVFKLGSSIYLDKREDSSDDIIVETQVIKQLHDMLNDKAEKFNDVTYDMYHDPKGLIKEKDESIDERFQDKIDHFRAIKDNFKQDLQETKDSITQKFATKKNQATAKLLDELKADADSDDEEQKSEFMENLEKINSEKPRFRGDEKYSFNKREDDESGDDVYIPLSVIDEYDITSPRQKNYSQVYYHLNSWKLNTTNFVKRLNDKCVQITWYNIFHHSIFGKPNFCIG